MSNEPEGKSKRHRRLLSGEEHALWEAVAKTAKPLRKKAKSKATAKIVSPKTLSKTTQPKESLASAVASPLVRPPIAQPRKPRSDVAPQMPPAKKLQPAPPAAVSLGRRERGRLAKGRSEIDGRLDLHGLTQHEAHDRLLGFLHAMQGRRASFVLVITGKGRRTESGSERGVLRQRVPQWLILPEFRKYVSAFEEAHIGHGGEGALYVRIRKAK